MGCAIVDEKLFDILIQPSYNEQRITPELFDELEGANENNVSDTDLKSKRSHLCDLCDRSFSTGSELKVHIEIHKGLRKLCLIPACVKTFTTAGGLRLHMKGNAHRDFNGHPILVNERDADGNPLSVTNENGKGTMQILQHKEQQDNTSNNDSSKKASPSSEIKKCPPTETVSSKQGVLKIKKEKGQVKGVSVKAQPSVKITPQSGKGVTVKSQPIVKKTSQRKENVNVIKKTMEDEKEPEKKKKIALCGLRWFKLNMSKRWGNSVQGVWGTGGIGHGAYWQWGHRGYGAHG